MNDTLPVSIESLEFLVTEYDKCEEVIQKFEAKLATDSNDVKLQDAITKGTRDVFVQNILYNLDQITDITRLKVKSELKTDLNVYYSTFKVWSTDCIDIIKRMSVSFALLKQSLKSQLTQPDIDQIKSISEALYAEILPAPPSPAFTFSKIPFENYLDDLIFF